MKTESAQIIELPKILDKRGNLSIIEEFKNIPFKIRTNLLDLCMFQEESHVGDMHIEKMKN
mgnify:CR=1 FL=1